jgi:hypothetical protein
VRALAAALRRAGIRTWLDLENLAPGQKWKEAIAGALMASHAMVFCISRLSLESAWINVELEKARSSSLPILPVAIEALDLFAIPKELQDLHVYDMTRHPPRNAAVLTACEIASALQVPADQLAKLNVADLAVIDSIAVVMDAAQWPSVLARNADGLSENVEYIDFSSPDRINLMDLDYWAARARRATVIVGAESDPALVGLVIGALSQTFGSPRLKVLTAGEPTQQLESAAGIVKVAFDKM